MPGSLLHAPFIVKCNGKGIRSVVPFFPMLLTSDLSSFDLLREPDKVMLSTDGLGWLITGQVSLLVQT